MVSGVLMKAGEKRQARDMIYMEVIHVVLL